MVMPKIEDFKGYFQALTTTRKALALSICCCSSCVKELNIIYWVLYNMTNLAISRVRSGTYQTFNVSNKY